MFREVEIGRTVLGRSMSALHFVPPSYARPRPPAVLLGAIHGDEPVAARCLSRLCDDLLERPPGRDAWIIPALNLDGLAAGTKNNARDVDLDRNFAATSWTPAHQPGYAPGPAPESEPETRALVQLIERVQPARLVSVHSTYRVLLWDGAGQELAEAMAARNGYPASPGADAPKPGSFRDRYGADLGLEVVTLEIPFVEEDEAWQQNRAALRHVLDLPT